MRAFLRTHLGRGDALRREIVESRGGERPFLGLSWRDVPMQRAGDGWSVEFTLNEVGYFLAKAFAVDDRGFQVWPEGPNVGISVHPNGYRSANTIYCAFPRLFGATRSAASTENPRLHRRLQGLEKEGYAVLPPSGKLRDLARELPHIVDGLGCRILHLLPVNPTPTTYARFGRFGSPYAALDLTAIDPALVEFDRRTTGVEQFCELARATHARGVRLFLDLVVNHTGWSASLQEQHPEWYLRDADGRFVSPGAWGVTWEDLVELDDSQRDLWDQLATAFLTWCRRGVDGFRCDAGYKVPMPVWQYLIARVREEYPDTVFLLEGLGGSWQDTETLLTEGGMQWAYSELFQEYAGFQVSGYLDHALRQSSRVGILVHYSETHDNERLAGKGRAWSLLRNRLCALTSVGGGFGFTCGVEWLAAERVDVHGCTGLNWGAADHLLPELKQLTQLVAEHPCFLDGARCTRLSPPASPVLALQRDSAEGLDRVLVLVNTEVDKPAVLDLPAASFPAATPVPLAEWLDLLGQRLPPVRRQPDGVVRVELGPGAAYCLADCAKPRGLTGDRYRLARARAAWWIQALRHRFEPEDLGPHSFVELAAIVAADPHRALGAADHLERELARRDLLAALQSALKREVYPRVIVWERADVRRVTLVPPQHWLLVRDSIPFRATLTRPGSDRVANAESVPMAHGHVACFLPHVAAGPARLTVQHCVETAAPLVGELRCLAAEPSRPSRSADARRSGVVLLTNGRGGMARMSVDLGRITSKYDCLLAANLHPHLPVDRHVFAKRVRVWANASGFITPLNGDNLLQFDPGPPARWAFGAVAGDGQRTGIELLAAMVPDANVTVLRFGLLPTPEPGLAGERASDVRLTVRVDIEDRSFHAETKCNSGSEHHFHNHTQSLPDQPGFAFTPASDRQLRVYASSGVYHPAPEWSHNIPHPVEASRGQEASGDAYSPGWFDLLLTPGKSVTVWVSADPKPPAPPQDHSAGKASAAEAWAWNPARHPSERADAAGRSFGRRLLRAARDFIVRRDDVRTVIAGYPWFLDWGRDTLICARGLLAGGMTDEVLQLLVAFGRCEEHGTLPNTIHGENALNRDTSDAPLWYGIVAEELAAQAQRAGASDPRSTVVDRRGRTVADVLRSIAVHNIRGTPNGIRMDLDSGLIWSPSHFTWMDTNYPAGTPREGYPVEIQALWIRLLRQLASMGAAAPGESWGKLADRAEASLLSRFWLEDQGWFADALLVPKQAPARAATPDSALRSNALFPISLGLVRGDRARRCVEAAQRHLLVPGALRSLAPLPVSPPLPIRSADGRLLNDPAQPYWGRYEGDEETRRKPAYHNGTAWVWTLPTFCEALACAWDYAPEPVAAARAILGSVDALLDEGCLGHLPEILDGDAPHTQRGCDAQAWSVTEVLRVWQLLGGQS